MAKNIEIKARAHDLGYQEELAALIATEAPVVIEQEDVFFNCPTGRIKLRCFPDGRGELIQYCRKDSSGPSQSEYSIVETDNPQALRDALDAAYGIRGIVRKTRRLYISGKTRIHLDSVDELGDYLELEVVLGENDTAESGERTVLRLMSLLHISDSELVDTAYIDLIEKHG